MFELDDMPLEGKPYFRADQAWTAPMNFTPEFRQTLDLRGPHYIYDVTLRDGEQTPGVAFTLDEKIKLARELDALGAGAIEVGVPMVEKDFTVIQALRGCGLKAKVACLTRASRADIDLAVDAGVEMICVEHSVNPYSCRLAYNIGVDELIERNVNACLHAKEKGVIVNWMGWDAFRQPLEYIEKVFKAVVSQADPDRITIADTFGMAHPAQVQEFFRLFRSWFPGKMLEYHCHNDYGLAVGNAISAITGGANSVHTAINGLGERAGNIALEEFAMAAQVALGVDFGIELSRLSRISKLTTQFGRFPVAPNKPVVGSNLFNVDSGMIIHIFQAAEKAGFPCTVMLPYLPETVGRDDFRFVYGKGAGGAALAGFLSDLGYTASEDQQAEILAKLKHEAGLRKAFLTEEEFRQIVESVIV